MLAIDFFPTGTPMHLSRIHRLLGELDKETVSPKAFINEVRSLLTEHLEFTASLLADEAETQLEAAKEALPGASAWLQSFLILAIVKGYRCDDIASFVGPQSVIRRLQGLVPLPSASSRPPRDLSRLYPTGWTNSLPASQTGKALPLPRAPPTSNISNTDSDDGEDDRAQSRLPSALAEEMEESLCKALQRKWPIITQVDFDLWKDHVAAHPEQATDYDKEKAVEVARLTRPAWSTRPALWKCSMRVCPNRTGVGKGGRVKVGRETDAAVS
ncbi:hypothetical protein BCR35DRAFT_227198 [Leucosporidium creatinivorum]|uniref:Uncharacterized protein n=1 Tax=Leucosporidium creatinivorum TaxID=106004 RepID=A0A1Y2D4T1_9BASI|nr:hypothetical protein BCR35DRAFT_227198 [Leucosporidium creatinivorum]